VFSVKRKDTVRVIVQGSIRRRYHDQRPMSLSRSGNDCDSSCFSFSITSSSCHSDVSEWILDMGSTYNICPTRELFAIFEELDGGVMSMRDDHTCWLVGKGTVHIKMYDGTMRELKNMRYITRMMKNLISVGNLEADGLRRTLGEGVPKMSSGSLVVLRALDAIKCTI